MLQRFVLTLLILSLPLTSHATDWLRFRGESGAGVSDDSASVPSTWSDSENLKWKCELPGPGLSSPIIVGDKVFVTCWTGFAAGEGSSDDQKDLKRLLVCVDRATGAIAWSKSVDAVLPEDDYRGMFAENGYASHTPVSDGKHVYCFFGKSGVVAFDLNGEQIWQTSVGTELDERHWGSASSPILFEDKVIVTASAESKSIVALDKETGKEVWSKPAPSLAGTWGTPVMVQVDDQRTDIVLAVPNEIWGLNPEDGSQVWHCSLPNSKSNSCTASVVVSDGDEKIAYVLGGRDSGAVAVRVGGEGDITESNSLWTGTEKGRISTPVIYNNRLYWISSGVITVIDATTREPIDKQRLAGGATQGGGRGPRGDYSSPIVADGKLYYFSRSGSGYVFKFTDDGLEQLAVNKFESDTGEISATPAVSDGQLFIRSTSTLYCVE
ncbi:outer membrane protein assembly factor BamB family protein [Aeoliella mucimassa]|uniref:Outer membrane biogenesis protein BamB n=1 Tax=Aeoliella mucimassa TaxID=2527972 RepID=A0A518AN79_9BACT|nr:PQQ-binding-like beta-propeller repeat protein [Aeoliella mucimassa]QDU56182.1 outer membrane biogenesis protein BamB [Aeoliella mucimassa]